MKIYATFEQSEEILDRMKAAGIDKAVVTLVGWNLGGHDGAYPQKFPVEPALGGEEGLRKLIAKAKGMGYQIVPHDSNTDMYMAAQTFDPDVLLRHADGTPVMGGIWGGGQGFKACPVAYFDRYGPDVTRIRDLGFEGHYYCDYQSNPLYRCHDPRHPADEEQFAMSQCKMTQAYRTLYGAVSAGSRAGLRAAVSRRGWTALPVQYRLVSPVRRSEPQAYHRPCRAVLPSRDPRPDHLPGALGARIPPWRGPQRFAPGAGLRRPPGMEVSYVPGANGDYYLDSIRDIQEGYRLAYEELADTHVELVADYEELAPEASRIVYANGTAVTVNWGDTPVGDLAPLSYRIDQS